LQVKEEDSLKESPSTAHLLNTYESAK